MTARSSLPYGRGPGRGANDNFRGWAEVHMPSDDVLGSRECANELAAGLNDVSYLGKKLSRRRVIDWLADRIYAFDGDVFNADGSRWNITEIEVDDPFTDPSFAWMGDFMKFEAAPPKQRMQRRVLPRLRLIYLALAIHYLSEDRRRRDFPPRKRA